MASFNKIIIVGYLGRDPEIRYSSQGTAVCDFSVATTEKRKDKMGEMQEITTWFRISLFGRQAEIAHQYLSKGRQVYVEGTLSMREWTDQNGVTRTSLDVRGSDIQFISPMNEEAHSQAAVAKASASDSRAVQANQVKAASVRPSANVTEVRKPQAHPTAKAAFDDDEIPF